MLRSAANMPRSLGPSLSLVVHMLVSEALIILVYCTQLQVLDIKSIKQRLHWRNTDNPCIKNQKKKQFTIGIATRYLPKQQFFFKPNQEIV